MFIMFLLLCSTLIVIPVLTDFIAPGKACSICNCSVEGTADCSFLNLTHVPEDLSVNITTLNMSSNRVKALEAGVFKKFKNLRVLDLYNNSLGTQNVSNLTFAGLSKMKILNISLNDQLPLTNATTPLEFFEHMPSLEVLKMYGTTGTYNIYNGYPDVQLSKLQYLRELWIDGLTDMPFGPGFRDMSHLKILRLAGDYIQPSWRSKEFCMTNLRTGMLDNLMSISHLYIRKCNLQTVDENVFRPLENLEYLDVSKNPYLTLKGISTAFKSLQNKTHTLVLNEIELSKPGKYTVTLTKDIVEQLQHLPLRELHLNHNNIQMADEGVFKKLPKSLRILSANMNNFYGGYYTLYVRYMENLRELDVSFQSFGKEIWQQPNYNDLSDGITHLKKMFLGRLNDNPRRIESRNKVENFEKQSVVEKRNNDSDLEKKAWLFKGIDSLIGSRNSIDEKPVNINFKLIKEEVLPTDKLRQKLEQHILPELICPQTTTRYIPPGTIIAHIPPKMEYADLSHVNLITPIYQMFFSTNNSLKILNASQSMLHCWEGPVHGLKKLQQLDLSSNFCNNISKKFFIAASSLKRLFIQNNFLGSAFLNDKNGEIMKPLQLLEVLNISFNRINKLPKQFLMSQRNLVVLTAHGNALDEFDIDIGHMKRLRVLDLSLNYISTLPLSIRGDLEKIASNINKTLSKRLFVNLRLNRIHCYCYNLDFLHWVYAHFQTDLSLVVRISECLFYKDQTGVYINSTEHLWNVIVTLENECRSYVGYIAGFSVLAAVIINFVVGIIVHKYRWPLQYWYYVGFDKFIARMKCCRSSYEPLGNYEYDVFVASTGFKTRDKCTDFILNKLDPKFKDRGLRVCILADEINGKTGSLYQLIAQGINKSRVILFVLNEGWSDDHEMISAVQMWQCDQVDRSNKNSVFGIRLEKLTGKHAEKVQTIYCVTFIDYPEEPNADRENTFLRECVDTIHRLSE